MDWSFYCEENISREKLQEIETEIKKYTGNDPDYIRFRNMTPEKWDDLEELFERRRWILNGLFKFTPVNIERIKKIDNRLRILTLKMYERVKAMEAKSSIILDDPDFDDDYEIEGSISFSWNDENSVLRLDDDENYGSDFNSMIHIIDSFYYAQGRFSHNILDVHKKNKNMDDNINWNEVPLRHRELNICYATHVICCHKLYSIPDLLRLNDFWAEVKFIEQNIRDAEGKKFEYKD